MQIANIAPFDDAKFIKPVHLFDERGAFAELWREDRLRANGVSTSYCQENISSTRAAGTIRGLHFQIGAAAQAKLFRCSRGAVFDVIVDLRHHSPTFGRHAAQHLDAENHEQIFIPAGFAHGFCTLVPDTEVIYKVTAYYDPAAARGVAWDDPALGIEWPVALDQAILLPRDRNYPRLAELPPYFP